MSQSRNDSNYQPSGSGPRMGGPGGGRPPGQGGRPGGPMGLSMPVEKAKDFWGTLKRLLKYLGNHVITLSIVTFISILSTIFGVVTPKISGNITTELFRGSTAKAGEPGIDFQFVINTIVFIAVLYFISSVFNLIQQYIMAGVTQKTVRQLRSEFNEKLSKLPLKFFDTRSHGEILSRVTNDIDNISGTLQQSVTQLISSIVTFLGVIVMMLMISPIMTLICFITIPLSLLVTRFIAKKSQGYFKAQQKVLGELNGHIEEMYSGHKIIKAYVLEEKSIEKFRQTNSELYKAAWKAQFISGIIMPLLGFINNIGYVFVCVAGGILAQGTLKIGDIQAFIQYSRQFTQPIEQISNLANSIQSTIASAERVFEIFDEIEEVPDKKNSKVLLNVRGDVAFENVEFGYTPENILIENMNIHAKKGRTVAIVGPTGAGKTTLVNLLMRFYECNSGRITIDGVDILDITRKNLRNTFGMVLQDTWLFSGTIKENIAYGKENATNDEIINAAKAAYSDHFIRTLPDGYDTLLNEEASNISAGERQLLTIARAILADPEILILDEATSSVDTRTEINIQNAMNKLMEGRTSFVIAHRLSTIKNADLILVMNNGSIIEQGTHKELLNMEGFYAELYNSQFTAKAITS